MLHPKTLIKLFWRRGSVPFIARHCSLINNIPAIVLGNILFELTVHRVFDWLEGCSSGRFDLCQFQLPSKWRKALVKRVKCQCHPPFHFLLRCLYNKLTWNTLGLIFQYHQSLEKLTTLHSRSGTSIRIVSVATKLVSSLTWWSETTTAMLLTWSGKSLKVEYLC